MPNLFYGVIYFWYLRGHCSFATLTNVIYVHFKRLLHLNVFGSSFLLCTLFQCNQCSLFSAAQAAAQTQFAFYSKINIRINGCQRKQTVRNTERSKAFPPHCIDFMSVSLPTCIYCFYLISERQTCFAQWILCDYHPNPNTLFCIPKKSKRKELEARKPSSWPSPFKTWIVISSIAALTAICSLKAFSVVAPFCWNAVNPFKNLLTKIVENKASQPWNHQATIRFSMSLNSNIPSVSQHTAYAH